MAKKRTKTVVRPSAELVPGFDQVPSGIIERDFSKMRAFHVAGEITPTLPAEGTDRGKERDSARVGA